MDQPWASRFSGLGCKREYLEKDHEGSVIISLNFGWILDNKLAGSRGPRSKQDLALLKNHGIGALVRLVESGETLVTMNDVNDAGLEDYNEPVRDFKAPTQEQIDKIITYIDLHLERGIPVGVSCNAGIGRTGVILACYLVHKGFTAKDAIDHLRKNRDRLPEVSEQIEAIKEYSLRTRPITKQDWRSVIHRGFQVPTFAFHNHILY